GQENGERVDEALELGGEHEVDEYHREEKQEVEAVARFAELLRLPGELVADGRWQIGLGDPVQVIQGLSQGDNGDQVRADRRRADAVVVVELLRGHGLLHLHDICELNQPLVAPYVDLLDHVGRRAPRGGDRRAPVGRRVPARGTG